MSVDASGFAASDGGGEPWGKGYGKGIGNVCGAYRDCPGASGIFAGAGSRYPRSGLYKVYERGDSLSGTDIWKYIAAFCFAGDICGNTGS